MKNNKMIRVNEEVRKLLKEKKKYKRETYSEVIKRELRKAGKLK